MRDFNQIEDNREENGEFYDYMNPKDDYDLFYLLADLI